MRKILSVAEFQNSEWPKLFEEAFGDNLVSAFIHGDCLMEGYSALEFLHIKSRNATICGETPLANFSPNLAELRMECERELRGLLVHLHQFFLYLKEYRNPHEIYVRSTKTLLPLLYGVYYLSTGKYPENHEQVYEMFPGVRIPNMTNDKNVIISNINKHIEAVTAIVNQVDAMKV